MTIRTQPARTTTRPPALDDVGRQLVEMLQRDGRRSYVSMAADLSLSEAAVRHRVQRLVELGVIQVVAVTDPTQVGFARQAMVGIHVDGDPSAPVADLEALVEVEYLVSTAGTFDLLVEVVCEDDDHLLDLLARIRRVPGVRTTETFLYLKLHRQRYDWGTR